MIIVMRLSCVLKKHRRTVDDKQPMLQDYRQDAMKVVWETDGVDLDPVILWGDNLKIVSQIFEVPGLMKTTLCMLVLLKDCPIKQYNIKFRFKILSRLRYDCTRGWR